MSYSVGQIHKYSVKFYQELQKETGMNVGFRNVSNIRLAQTQERMDEYRQYAGVASTIGVQVDFLTPEQVQEIFTRIYAVLNHKVPQYFAEVKPQTPAGEQRVVDDIQYLCNSLERLRGVSAANLNFEQHFRERFPNAR